MSAEQVRETMQEYVTVLLERGPFGRFFAEEVEARSSAPTSGRPAPKRSSR